MAPSLQPVSKASQDHRRVPALPAALGVLGLAALGLATAGLSYARTRARVRRTRADARPRAWHQTRVIAGVANADRFAGRRTQGAER